MPSMSEKQQEKGMATRKGPSGENCTPLGLGEGRSQTIGPLGHGENAEFA